MRLRTDCRGTGRTSCARQRQKQLRTGGSIVKQPDISFESGSSPACLLFFMMASESIFPRFSFYRACFPACILPSSRSMFKNSTVTIMHTPNIAGTQPSMALMAFTADSGCTVSAAS